MGMPNPELGLVLNCAYLCSSRLSRYIFASPSRLMKSDSYSKQCRQVPPSVHDTNDFDPIDRTFVCVGMRFIENKIISLDQHTRRWTDVRPSRPKSRIVNQPLRSGFNKIVYFLGCCGIVEADGYVDVEQILLRLGRSDQFNRQVPALFWLFVNAAALPV